MLPKNCPAVSSVLPVHGQFPWTREKTASQSYWKPAAIFFFSNSASTGVLLLLPLLHSALKKHIFLVKLLSQYIMLHWISHPCFHNGTVCTLLHCTILYYINTSPTGSSVFPWQHILILNCLFWVIGEKWRYLYQQTYLYQSHAVMSWICFPCTKSRNKNLSEGLNSEIERTGKFYAFLVYSFMYFFSLSVPAQATILLKCCFRWSEPRLKRRTQSLLWRFWRKQRAGYRTPAIKWTRQLKSTVQSTINY